MAQRLTNHKFTPLNVYLWWELRARCLHLPEHQLTSSHFVHDSADCTAGSQDSANCTAGSQDLDNCTAGSQDSANCTAGSHDSANCTAGSSNLQQ